MQVVMSQRILALAVADKWYNELENRDGAKEREMSDGQ
jgi:hypothetical protein